ncbi:MAG: SRPBCC domain-containing protein [Pseudomonadota bacterium]
MNAENYSRTITVRNTASAAFDALTTGFEYWWTKPDKPIQSPGDQAKFTFPPGKSYWTFKAMQLEQDKRIELVCTDALHLHEGKPEEIRTEWLGTRVVWDIRSTGGTTEITLEHHGLVPTLLCYDICEAGWDFFFLDSLKSYLETGTGKPHDGSGA